MIDGLKPYPRMKDSGVEWLGEVPEGWEVCALRYKYDQSLGKMLDSKRITGDHLVPYLRNIDVQWDRINVSDLPRMDIPIDEYDRYTVRAGDLLVCEGGEIGRCAIWNGDLPTCGFQKALHRLRPRAPDELPRYLYYSLSAAASRGVFDDGHVSTIGHLTGDKLRGHRFAFPPIAEQAAIVRFLDHTDRRIRRYIRAKQNLIRLLEEQKQAIIHRAVTRGLDPDVPLKQSGVEWLGEVPEHWEVRKLKTLCSMKSGAAITSMSIEVSGGYPVYGGNGIRGYTSACTHDGDFVLVGRQGALCGNVHIARGRFWASEHAVVVIVERGLEIDWFAALLAVMNLNQYSIAAAQPGLAVERILNLAVPLPPPNEQRAIAEHIGKVSRGAMRAISAGRSQITLLREFRTRLIADVVTGKLDVREAAARLPDGGAVPEPPVEEDSDEITGAREALDEELDEALEEIDV